MEYVTYTDDDLTVYVQFDYQPEEKMVMYPNEKAHPGCPADAIIYEVLHDGVDIFDKISDSELVRMREDILLALSEHPDEI